MCGGWLAEAPPSSISSMSPRTTVASAFTGDTQSAVYAPALSILGASAFRGYGATNPVEDTPRRCDLNALAVVSPRGSYGAAVHRRPSGLSDHAPPAGTSAGDPSRR